MEIKLGPAGNCTSSSGTEDSLRIVKDIGLNAQEIEFVRSVYLSQEKAKAIGELGKDLEIGLSVHASYYINLCSSDKKQKSIERILKAASRGEALNASVVVFHPGYYQKLDKKEAFRRVKDACKEMEKKVDKIKLGLETTGKHSQFGSLDEIIQICKDLDKCVPVVDFAHLFARRYGRIDYSRILDKLEELNLDHLHTHFSNIEYTSKGEKKHLNLDHQPDFRPLAKEILNRKLNITLICESPILEQDALKMKKIFEELGTKIG